MTIALSIKVNDGIVLACDSATTLSKQLPDGKTETDRIYNNANKLFNLRKGLPIAGMTWGAGNIGHASIATLAKDLRQRFTEGEGPYADWHIDPRAYSIEDVAKRTRQFLFEELYEPTFRDWTEKPLLGFLVAGYSTGANQPEQYEIIIKDGQSEAPKLLNAGQLSWTMNWWGQPDPISRVVIGLSDHFSNILIKAGIPEDQVRGIVAQLTPQLQAPFVEDAMPIQDAIDLAEFLGYVCTEFFRFAYRDRTVGGPLEIAAITKHENFKWIRRKYYFDRGLNPEVV